jgi:hypothetical protein
VFKASCKALIVPSGRGADTEGDVVWAKAAKFGDPPMTVTVKAKTVAPSARFLRIGFILLTPSVMVERAGRCETSVGPAPDGESCDDFPRRGVELAT